ncbi:MAG: metal-dependent hydrolase [Thermoplasmata archaeon]|nr:metal-dependent hydrolase [Thermoplasmata archaeon]
MDPFSHILLGYLLGFGLWGPAGLQYVVASAFAGALPDADVVFYPLSTRFPLLRHRGMSHSVVGVTLVAAGGTFLVPQILAWAFGPQFGEGSLLFFFIALEVGGLSHVMLDAMDHWSVPIFAPFSKQEYHFDADRIMNFGAMAFVVFSYALMIYERSRVPVKIWEVTAWLLLAAAFVYFVVRLTARWRVGIAKKRLGFDDVIPQSNPAAFQLVARAESGGFLRLRTARYDLTSGAVSDAESLSIPLTSSNHTPVESRADALARSYPRAVAQSWILGETHHFEKLRVVEHGFDVFWYSLEMVFLGRAAGVLAHVDLETGAVKTRTAWRDPRRVFSPRA